MSRIQYFNTQNPVLPDNIDDALLELSEVMQSIGAIVASEKNQQSASATEIPSMLEAASDRLFEISDQLQVNRLLVSKHQKYMLSPEARSCFFLMQTKHRYTLLAMLARLEGDARQPKANQLPLDAIFDDIADEISVQEAKQRELETQFEAMLGGSITPVGIISDEKIKYQKMAS